ncbi:MAG: hypothetical protein JWM10_2788 [Myxococcaceae bacterium]|nr:hypothetical protein [Myxococcaceae bacterium]
MDTSLTEWVQLAPGRLLIATAESAWLEVGSAPRDEMRGPGSLATTRKLLDGAVGAAFSAARPEGVPALTRPRCVLRLAASYHLTHSTPALLTAAARGFAAQGRPALERWATEKVREESGHDRLALRDLEDLGYPALAVAEALRPSTAMRLLGYFEETARAADPVGSVGYSYAIERLATTVGEREIAAVEALLPAGSRATRCQRVHSSVGSDAGHVEDTLAVVAALSGPERAAIAVACYRTARICFEPPPDGYLSDEDIERTLRDLTAARAA